MSFRYPLSLLLACAALAAAAAPVVAQNATGGPDTFGYRWADDRDPAGPTFNFESTSGTGIFLGDDQVSGALPIGFTFEFYGNTFTDFYVSSNGFISFNAGVSQGCCSGDPLPSTQGVPNMIAHYWNDLYPPGAGTITYETKGTAPNRYLVLELNGMAHCCSSTGQVTLQLKLFESSNNIEIHMQSVTNDGSFFTVGIQDAAMSDGLQYINATTPNFTNRAIRFSTLQPEVNLDGATKDFSASFTEGGAPAALAGTVGIAGVTTVDSATATLTNPLDGTAETIAAMGQGAVTVTPNGSNTELTLTGPAPLADFEATIATLVYENTSDNPSTGTNRTVEVTITTSGSTGPPATATITLAATNDAPTITLPSAANEIESDATSGLTNGFTVGDPDVNAGNLEVDLAVNQGATLSATVNGSLVITGNSTASMTLTGSLTEVNTAIGTLMITPAALFVGQLTIDVSVDDLGNTGSPGAATTSDFFNVTVIPAKELTVSIGSLTETDPNTFDLSTLAPNGNTLLSGEELTFTITVTSSGPQPVTISSVTLEVTSTTGGGAEEEFTAEPTLAPIASGNSLMWDVRIVPISNGPVTYTFTINSDDTVNPEKVITLEFTNGGFTNPSDCSYGTGSDPSLLLGLLALIALGAVVRRRLV